MFHICFAANENYIKYCAVVITSIIKSTDTSKKFKEFFEISKAGGGHLTESNLAEFKKLDYDLLTQDEQNEGYLFHIISNDISQNSQNKLQALAKDLNQTYPCRIQVHICDESQFKGLPQLNNYSTYFKFFIPDCMPENLKYCLYLDVDMLVLQDLRGLFSLDLKNKCVGVIQDKTSCLGKRHSKIAGNKDFVFKDFYFNAGFLLINLDEWRAEKIIEKCFTCAQKYELKWHDQDAFNMSITKSKALVLPFGYNCLLDVYSGVVCNDDKRNFSLDYSRKAVISALENPIIIHFTPYKLKSWNFPYHFIDTKGKALGLYWWNIALQTPNFAEELQEELSQITKNHLENKEFKNYVAFLMLHYSNSLLGYLKMPFALYQVFKRRESGANFQSSFPDFSQNEYNLASELIHLAELTFSKKGVGRKISLPYEAWRIKRKYKKYGFNK